MKPPMFRLSQWHRDTPLKSLTVAGAAQELRRSTLGDGGRAPVSRLTPPKKFGRGTRERASILAYGRAGLPASSVRLLVTAPFRDNLEAAAGKAGYICQSTFKKIR